MPILTVMVAAITSGLLALVLLWPRVHSGPAAGRMVGEMFVTTLALSALIYVLLVVTLRLPW